MNNDLRIKEEYTLDTKASLASLISPHLKTIPSPDNCMEWDDYLLNGTSQTLNMAYMERVLERFHYMSDRYSKLLQVRLDLHFPSDWTPNPKLENERISEFCRQMKHNYFKRDQGIHIEYAWCREIEKAKKAHYHCVIWVSGHKKKSAGLPCIEGTMAFDLNKIWNGVTEGNGLITHAESHRMQRKNPDELKAAVYIASYLCKTRGKVKVSSAAGGGAEGERVRIRSFGCSELPD